MDWKNFCQELPKIECHAHLSGSVPLEVLQELHRNAKARHPHLPPCPIPSDYSDLQCFFKLFSDHIYRILDTPEAVTQATKAVLNFFRNDGCIYLELRTTPRKFQTNSNSFEEYLDAIFAAVDQNDESQMIVRLILSVNWDFEPSKVKEVVQLAIATMKSRGCVVGIDVAGDPRKSLEYTNEFVEELVKAKASGLKLTIHFAEIPEQKCFLRSQLDALFPDRLGHAVFLTPEIQENIVQHERPIEICLTSNLKVGSIKSLDDHHFKWAVENGVPVLISTDDALVFDTTLSEEYRKALSLLNNDRHKLLSLLKASIRFIFGSSADQEVLIQKVDKYVMSM